MLQTYSRYMRIKEISMQPAFKYVMATQLYSNANVILDLDLL